MEEIVFRKGGRNQLIFETMWRFNQDFWFEDAEPENTTNLCQWIRVVIIWPFFHVTAFAASAYALFSAITYCLHELADPMVSSNFWRMIIQTLIGIVFIVAVIIAWLSIRTWAGVRENRAYNRLASHHSESVDGNESETPWYKLVWTYLFTLKRQVCPVIRYTSKVDEETI